MKQRTLTHSAWEQEAQEKFGEDPRNWSFVCPSCGHVATLSDWNEAGAPQSGWAFSCVGRWLEKPAQMGEKPGPCNYAGGGLFRLNPVTVQLEDGGALEVFEFDQ